MNGWTVAATAAYSLSAATVNTTQAAVPAWQAPDFVMEEVVVSAVRPAWQAPGFVMEEVVAVATAKDIADAWREQMHQRARILVAQLAREAIEE